MPEKIEVVISETTMVYMQNTLRFQEEIRSDVLYCCLVYNSDNLLKLTQSLLTEGNATNMCRNNGTNTKALMQGIIREVLR